MSAKPIPETNRSLAAIKRVTPRLTKELADKSFKLGDPVFLRIIKSQSPSSERITDGVLEIYLQGADGKYSLFKTKDICAASGTLGPKTKTGDHQSPEGFYYITAGRFNPWSSYHLSLNLGYPNAYDRARGYTGDFLMIHGECVSIGCYAMTNAGIEEIYALVSAANKNGQKVIRGHSFPFPMSVENLTLAKTSKHYDFWKNLKQGWDWFEEYGAPPNVEVRDRDYVFSDMP
ncbi:MAG: L,D-transpeptidase family protein [Robiginitomaculum sp.]|nr:L,D-transpeptidase family protein [Robiginitomaculum sp.]